MKDETTDKTILTCRLTDPCDAMVVTRVTKGGDVDVLPYPPPRRREGALVGGARVGPVYLPVFAVLRHRAGATVAERDGTMRESIHLRRFLEKTVAGDRSSEAGR